MYQGNNPAALRLQELLAQGMLKLLGQYAFPEITVTMICQEAAVSRQTFYKVFGSKEEVIRYAITSDFDPLQERIKARHSYGLEEFSLQAVTFFYPKRQLINYIIRDNLEQLFLDSVQKSLRSVLLLLDNSEMPLQEPLYSFFAAGLSSLFLYELAHWDEERLKADVKNFSTFLGNPKLLVKRAG